ncbi:Fukutin [Halotydeus destructor]|nr:Fukutin [Halotydeus destructor]
MTVRKIHKNILQLLLLGTIVSFLFYSAQLNLQTIRTAVTDDQLDSVIIGNFTSVKIAEEVTEFLNISQSFGYKIFLIEPCILWSTVTNANKRFLKTRDAQPTHASRCHKTSSQQRLVSLGVMAANVPDRKFFIHLKSQGFDVATYGLPYVLDRKALHFVANKNGVYLHVSTFTQRGQFFYIHQLDHTLLGLDPKDLRFGRKASAFDHFKIRSIRIANSRVRVPDDIGYFLFQINSATFLECNRDMADMWNSKYPAKDTIVTKNKATVKVIRDMIRKLWLPIFMEGGSLLGWARHCSQVPHEQDADFATFARYNEDKFDLASKIQFSVSKPWYFVESFGFPWSGFEMRLWNFDLSWQVDLFFLTQDRNDSKQLYSGYHTSPGIYWYKYVYNADHYRKLCSAEVHGTLMMVPCSFNDVLVREYGPEWVVPDTKHVLKGIGKRVYWPEKYALDTYQCLGKKNFNIKKHVYDKNATDYQGVLTPVPGQVLQDVMHKLRRTCIGGFFF